MKRERQRVTVPINGKRVKYLIKLAGTTQIKLADQIGYTKDRLNQILRTGKALPRVIETLGSALNADPRYITGEMNYCYNDLTGEDLEHWQNLIDSGSVRLDPENYIIMPYWFYSVEIKTDELRSLIIQLINAYIDTPASDLLEEHKNLLKNMPESYVNRIVKAIQYALGYELGAICRELTEEKDNK